MAVIQIEVLPVGLPEGSAIGLVALKHYYSIYDIDHNEVGFAVYI